MPEFCTDGSIAFCLNQPLFFDPFAFAKLPSVQSSFSLGLPSNLFISQGQVCRNQQRLINVSKSKHTWIYALANDNMPTVMGLDGAVAQG
jgi:hypothetical protein